MPFLIAMSKIMTMKMKPKMLSTVIHATSDSERLSFESSLLLESVVLGWLGRGVGVGIGISSEGTTGSGSGLSEGV